MLVKWHTWPTGMNYRTKQLVVLFWLLRDRVTLSKSRRESYFTYLLRLLAMWVMQFLYQCWFFNNIKLFLLWITTNYNGWTNCFYSLFVQVIKTSMVYLNLLRTMTMWIIIKYKQNLREIYFYIEHRNLFSTYV